MPAAAKAKKRPTSNVQHRTSNNGKAKHETNGHASNGKAVGKPIKSKPDASAPPTPGVRMPQLLKLLAVGRFQPRQDFDDAKLDELAADIKANGLLTPLIIRERSEGAMLLPEGEALVPTQGQTPTFDIVAGERRARAALKLGWNAIDCCIARGWTDSHCRTVALADNEQREQLNDLERADFYQRMIDQEQIGPTELARRINKSQAYVSNLLRLRKLPEAWKARIISAEIAPSAARDLVPFVDYPDILADISERIGAMPYVPTGADWSREVAHAVRYRTRPMDRDADPEFIDGRYQACLFDPTPEQRGELALIDVAWSDTPRATNWKLWDDLQKAARAKQTGKLFSGTFPDPEEGDEDPHAGGDDATDGDDELGFTMEELAGEQTTDNTDRTDDLSVSSVTSVVNSDDEGDAKLRERVDAWKVDWLAYLCAKQLKPGSAEQWTLLLCLAGEYGHTTDRWHGRCQDRAALLAQTTAAEIDDPCPTVARPWGHPPHPLAAIPLDTIKATSNEFLKACLWDFTHQRPAGLVAPHFITALADRMSIDLVEAWRADKAGPLTEAFFQLHNSQQLARLGKELGVYLDRALKNGKARAVETLLQAPSHAMPCPKVLLPPPPKPKRQPPKLAGRASDGPKKGKGKLPAKKGQGKRKAK